MSATNPIDHVLRALPPWDDQTFTTECGRDDVAGKLLTRDQFVAKIAEQGQQRSAMTTCMTCWNTASKYRPWNVSPTETMARWLGPGWRSDEHDVELRAIAALIEAHRDEYDGYIHGVDQAEDLGARRRRKQQEEAKKGARVTGPHRL